MPGSSPAFLFKVKVHVSGNSWLANPSVRPQCRLNLCMKFTLILHFTQTDYLVSRHVHLTFTLLQTHIGLHIFLFLSATRSLYDSEGFRIKAPKDTDPRVTLAYIHTYICYYENVVPHISTSSCHWVTGAEIISQILDVLLREWNSSYSMTREWVHSKHSCKYLTI